MRERDSGYSIVASEHHFVLPSRAVSTLVNPTVSEKFDICGVVISYSRIEPQAEHKRQNDFRPARLAPAVNRKGALGR